MDLQKILDETLRHISRLTYYLDMSDEDRLRAYKFVSSAIWDYHRIYEPYTKIFSIICCYYITLEMTHLYMAPVRYY